MTQHICFIFISFFPSLSEIWSTTTSLPNRWMFLRGRPATRSLWALEVLRRCRCTRSVAEKCFSTKKVPSYGLTLIVFWSSEIFARVSSVKEEWRWRRHPLCVHLRAQTQHDYEFSICICRQNERAQSNGRFVLLETLSLQNKSLEIEFLMWK